jgi:hypothetical protein
VRLDSGTSIVLAQTGFKDTNHWLPVGWTDDDTMLFYVISADVD